MVPHLPPLVMTPQKVGLWKIIFLIDTESTAPISSASCSRQQVIRTERAHTCIFPIGGEMHVFSTPGLLPNASS